MIIFFQLRLSVNMLSVVLDNINILTPTKDK